MRKYVLTHWLVQFNLLAWLGMLGVAWDVERGSLFYPCIAGFAIALFLEHVYYRHVYRPWKDAQQAPCAEGRK